MIDKQENTREEKSEDLKEGPVKNPNPAANANVEPRTGDERKRDTSEKINSEITDGEDG